MDPLTRLALDAAAGDRDALSGFVRASQADVWRLCAHLGGWDRADDLTQETYLRALPALDRFRAEAGARTWLLAIARNTCADHVRREVRRRALEARLAGEAAAGSPEGFGRAVDPGGLVDLEAVLADLDPDRREAFVLTQVLGLGYAEAAEVVGCPIGTIRSRVARARDDLVGRLGADDATDVDHGAGDAGAAGRERSHRADDVAG